MISRSLVPVAVLTWGHAFGHHNEGNWRRVLFGLWLAKGSLEAADRYKEVRWAAASAVAELKTQLSAAFVETAYAFQLGSMKFWQYSILHFCMWSNIKLDRPAMPRSTSLSSGNLFGKQSFSNQDAIRCFLQNLICSTILIHNRNSRQRA